MNSEVLVSIIMAAYNAEAFIEDAIYSVLNQTHKNLELIVVDDASTDSTSKAIFKIKDNRLKYIRNTTNIGAGESRNIGLQQSKGQYIAIMDSDDIAFPDRIEKQLLFLEKNQETDILSGGIKLFGNGNHKKIYFPESPEFIKAWLLFKNCIHNPTTMFRRRLLDDFRYNNMWFGEDYYLWIKLTEANYKISNINDILIHYRIHAEQITNKDLETRRKILNDRLVERLSEKFECSINDQNKDIVSTFINTRLHVNESAFKTIKHFLDTLYMENTAKKIYEPAYFNAVLYFFYLRLGKYFYIEYKKQPLHFLRYFAAVINSLSLKSLYIFLRNNKGYR